MKFRLTSAFILSTTVLVACGDDSAGPGGPDAAQANGPDAARADTDGVAVPDGPVVPDSAAPDTAAVDAEAMHEDAAVPASDAQALVDTSAPTPDGLADMGIARDSPIRDAGPTTQGQLVNVTAYIPPQCYAQTRSPTGRIDNPCYTCHKKGVEPNFVDDSPLQLDYVMPQAGRKNPWTNLFRDRSASIAAISDATMRAYVNADNYTALPAKLRKLPAAWDKDGDGVWSGYLPDCAFSFDDRGFDRTGTGDYTGWRAFAYYPIPGVWPTNGWTGDLLIRLAEPFRRNDAGQLDLDTYVVNLAILEALITRRDVAIDPVDEKRYGVDLDKDGTLGTASTIEFDWAPTQGRNMSFVGQAKTAQSQGEVHLAAGLFPEGTEFVRTVRYLNAEDDIRTTVAAPRLKELRYARKIGWRTYSQLENTAMDEIKDEHDFPDETHLFPGDAEHGIYQADSGWILQGFIEDSSGDLRPQTFEETAYCMGCHGGGIGATTDSTFAFARKLDGGSFRRGWYAPSQRGLAGLREPKVELPGGAVHYEYAYYLLYTHSGSELLANEEVHDLFFDASDTPKMDRFTQLHDDVTLALVPSAVRAMALNKAYKVIVDEQSFDKGRDVTLGPAPRMLEKLGEQQDTGITKATLTGAFAGCYGPRCQADRVTDPLDDFAKTIEGAGMAGPDGESYDVDWQGIIHKSRYTNPGVPFTFPPRLTPPTREIVALGSTASCYTCHRMHAPIVDGERMTTLEPAYPAVTTTTTEAAMLTRLTSDAGNDTGARFSPDGSTIAFVSDRSGTDQVWLMNADGTGQRMLTQGPTKHAWPEWHPDGSRLLVWSYDGSQQSVQSITVDGAQVATLLTSDDIIDRPVYRPDGAVIAYGAQIDGNWDIWVVDADGSHKRRLTSEPAMESNPHWSPDGQALAYKVAPTGRYGLTVENFMTFENGLDRPTVHPWNGPQAIQMNDYSPDGSQVAYTAEIISGASGRDRVSYANVVSTVDISGTEAVATTSTILSQGQTIADRGAVFSPDGKQVAFWAWDQRYRATLWLYDLTARRLRQLTTEGFDRYPQWSRDGKALVFESNRGGSTDLWLLRVP